jgi:hypothetical protein
MQARTVPHTSGEGLSPMSTDNEAVRELLGPLADLPSPPSPDDRDDESDGTPGGIIPGTGRRAEDHQPSSNTEPGQ